VNIPCRRLFFCLRFPKTISCLFSLVLAPEPTVLAAFAISLYQLQRELEFYPDRLATAELPNALQSSAPPLMVLQFAQLVLELSLFTFDCRRRFMSPQQGIYLKADTTRQTYTARGK